MESIEQDDGLLKTLFKESFQGDYYFILCDHKKVTSLLDN